ncbi:unnamed protein product [Candida verbasci]|uniref:Lon protease homolog 2, peroxisomal n=1 Tax=Candida verbasci TaxID=1227364 RepID=A0A9W4TW52_9ASCO|nr:unnamed protein product [Candida verbasci]
MGKYSKKQLSSSDLKQQITLPTYKLDSNLVLLPGIIYNVTFSRFKAAALLYRFKNLVSQVSIINNLINEYNFREEDGEELSKDINYNPTVISKSAIEGISEFFKYEQISRNNLDTAGFEVDSNLSNEFDWLTMAITPNLDKIKDYQSLNINTSIVTVVRIVGIVDDTTNIKLTLQAISRGVIVSQPKHKAKINESLISIDWNNDVIDLKNKFLNLRTNYNKLYKSIEKFLIDYRQALNNSIINKNGNNLSLIKETKEDHNKKNNNPKDLDLLTLNPLANALYLQLAGSKDFTKAFVSLHKLFSQFSSASQDTKIDNRTYLRLIDLTCGILPFPNYEKLNLLNQYKIENRSELINSMILQLIDIFNNLQENNSFVNHWFHNEATNIQKANVVANQLKNIRVLLEGMTNKHRQQQQQNQQNKKPVSRKVKDDNEEEDIDDDDDDLNAITNFVKNKLPNISSISPDSKRLIVKDFKRIKSSANSPGGNSDFHVIRNYLEIVMDIPWDQYITKFKTNKEIDLKAAKKQLDDDHYGLEHVKKRLIQYLVILKLLGINAEQHLHEKLKNDKNKTSNHTSSPTNSNSIVLANNDETYVAKQKAQNKVKQSINDTNKFDKSINESIQVSKNNKSPIIMLAGPPGTGKTSLAKSIATALGRNFQRISLGGIKDESEIRGHRRTYVGAMPGLLIQALRKSRSMNPVILLDEIDKVIGGNSGVNKFNGDPSAALLEVLDPEQNSTFIDHYIGFPVDLSQVIFICTANEPHNMTRPLLDRLEMIEIGAYDYNEKLIIGKKYLLPRQIKRNGFPVEDDVSKFINMDENTVKKVILDYTREAGVRNFERRLGTICRFKAVEYCEALSNNDMSTYNPIIDENDLPIYLGVPYSHGDFTSAESSTSIGNSRVGVVNGLSYNSEGSGSVLVFESIGFDRRFGKDEKDGGSNVSLTMTGRLGDVLMESGKIGLIFIKSMIYKNLINGDNKLLLDKYNSLDIHMHVPMGAISKDGPSAGLAMALSFLSVILDKPVPSDVAMTGEITLRGLALPIGGVKEKLMGAHLNGSIKRMILPRENRKDLIEEYTKSIEEAGEHIDHNFINEILKDNDEDQFKMNQIEIYYLKRYGIQLYYAKEFYDVVKIVWNDESILNEKINNREMMEYHI